MQHAERKAAIAAYREKKPAFGIFAVQCTATGQAWVGQSPNVDVAKNGLWFSLKHGSGRRVSLQKAWNAHEEADFRFVELDRLSEDFSALGRRDELKRRQALWVERLQAEAL